MVSERRCQIAAHRNECRLRHELRHLTCDQQRTLTQSFAHLLDAGPQGAHHVQRHPRPLEQVEELTPRVWRAHVAVPVAGRLTRSVFAFRPSARGLLAAELQGERLHHRSHNSGIMDGERLKQRLERRLRYQP